MEESSTRIRENQHSFSFIIKNLLINPNLKAVDILKTYLDYHSIDKFEDIVKKVKSNIGESLKRSFEKIKLQFENRLDQQFK